MLPSHIYTPQITVCCQFPSPQHAVLLFSASFFSPSCDSCLPPLDAPVYCLRLTKSTVRSWLLEALENRLDWSSLKKRLADRQFITGQCIRADGFIFSVCLIRNHPHFAFHLLDVCLDKARTWAPTDAKARAALDTKGESCRGSLL